MKTLLIICTVLLALPFIALAAPIPDTGQTKCYDNTQEITCPNPGEDFYGQDAQYLTHTQSYTKLDVSGNDLPDSATEWVMIRDNVTGLLWENKTDDGSIHDKDHTYNWQNAQDVFIVTLNSQNFGGYSDWRLPTVKELSSLIDSSIYFPAINTFYFPNTVSSYYWSSTTYAYDPSYAWVVSFYFGHVSNYSKSSNSYYVRAVRSGQSGSFGNYIDNDDGTVTDTDTNLMWELKTDDGGLRDKDNYYTWQQALSYCENLTLAGYDDWRLPNSNELQSIVDYNRYDPSIDPIFSNTVSSYYWSSTTYAISPYNAWLVYFSSGYVGLNYGKSSYGSYVRAVRGGLCGALGDSDGDTFCNDADSCIYDYNLFQIDCDNDGVGDICDSDTVDPDGDGVDVACDNCPNTPSENQADSYPPQGNGIGDACDCEGNFNCDVDRDVDGSDAALFKGDFGRSNIVHPCIAGDLCNGDFSCDGDVDGTDASLFKQDFGRGKFQNPCPACDPEIPWCVY